MSGTYPARSTLSAEDGLARSVRRPPRRAVRTGIRSTAVTDASSAHVDTLGLVDRVAALHRVDLFADVPGRVLAAVAELTTEIRISPGDMLIEEGAVEAYLYAIVNGRVRVHRGDRTLVELGPGTTVGELAALVAQPRTAAVTALEPTLALRLDKVVLDDLLLEWPELAHGVIGGTRRPTARDSGSRRQVAMSDTPPRGVVGLLTAQALAFGVTLALLIIPANALFLDAYGSEWLPATYIAIAVFGSGASALIARAARRTQTRPRRHSEPRRPRRTLRRVLADPRCGRRLGVGGAPRAVPDRAPDGVRLHRRTGRQAPRRPADEGEIPSRRVGIRRRVPPGRPPRDPPPRPARIDRAPAARNHGRAARVPRPSARDRATIPGGARRSRRGRAGGRPAAVADALRLGPRSLPSRLPGAVRDGLAGGRLPPVRPCRSPVQRGRPDPIPVRAIRQR